VNLYCRLPTAASRLFAAAPLGVPGHQAAAQHHYHQQQQHLRRLQRSTGLQSPVSWHVCRCQAAQQPLPDDSHAATAQQQYEDDGDSMAQYEQLKADMNRTTRRFAAFLSGYLLLTTTSDVSALDPSLFAARASTPARLQNTSC
jgi:hypothetical protein